MHSDSGIFVLTITLFTTNNNDIQNGIILIVNTLCSLNTQHSTLYNVHTNTT